MYTLTGTTQSMYTLTSTTHSMYTLTTTTQSMYTLTATTQSMYTLTRYHTIHAHTQSSQSGPSFVSELLDSAHQTLTHNDGMPLLRSA